MGLYLCWRSICDQCKIAGPVSHSKESLLDDLRREGWKRSRKKTSSGRTRDNVLCPGCIAMNEAGRVEVVEELKKMKAANHPLTSGEMR